MPTLKQKQFLNTLSHHLRWKKKMSSQCRPNYKWEKKDVSTVRLDSVVFEEDIELLMPLQYFSCFFFTLEIITFVTEQTNLYFVHCDQVSVNTSECEKNIYFPYFCTWCNIFAIICNYCGGPTKVPQITGFLLLKSFGKIRKYICFCNNEELKNSTNRFFKMCPILNIFRNQCLKVEEEISLHIIKLWFHIKDW